MIGAFFQFSETNRVCKNCFLYGSIFSCIFFYSEVSFGSVSYAKMMEPEKIRLLSQKSKPLVFYAKCNYISNITLK